MHIQTLLLMAALIGGLILGVLLTLLLNRRRVQDAVLLQTRNLEAEHSAQQNSWQLREASLMQDLHYSRTQSEILSARLTEAETQHRELQQKLSDVHQQLAGAREKLQLLEPTQDQLRFSEQRVNELGRETTELKTRLEQERKNFEEQLKILQDAKTELTREFENIANKIFDNKQQQFSISSKTLLETTIDPLKLQLSEFRSKVEDVYEKENAERNRLSGQVLELQKQAQKIGEDAINLAQALKGNSKAQGNWGEVILERLLEQAGLQKGREYDTQVSFVSEDGARRMPDVIVHLPENKDIIIDSKVSLVAYEKYCNSDNDVDRANHLAAHVNSLRAHVKSLSVKDYEKLEGIKSLDFVFIFIPIEAAFLLALQHEPGLSHEAYDRRVILVSPTNLLAILRTVENIWRYEKQNKNAERIAKDAGALHDQFVLLLDALDSVGSCLNRTQEAYDTARKRLQTGRGNLIKRVDDIRRLGAKTKKTIARDLLDETVEAEDLLLEDQTSDESLVNTTDSASEPNE